MKKKAGLGKWQVKRQADDQLLVTLPEGLKVTGSKLSIEDLLDAIQRYKVYKDGVVTEGRDEVTVKCCGGNTAIA